MFRSLYSTGLIPWLPKLMSDTSNGNYILLSQFFSLFYSTPVGSQQGSAGMQISVQCSEDLPFVTAEEFQAARAAHPRTRALGLYLLFHEELLTLCAKWGVHQPNPIENQPVVSQLPTFILSGEYDPITPPQWGPLTAETLKNSFVATYPRGGHGLSLSSPCLAQSLVRFLNNPRQQPDTACIAQEAPWPFVTSMDTDAAPDIEPLLRPWFLP